MHFLRTELGSPVPNLQPGGVTLVLEDESLLKLPDDILLMICSYCDQQSLKHVRSSCHRLATLAEAELFQELIIVPEWECIRTIRSIKNHPTICNRVKSVVYDLRMLDNFASPGSEEDDPSDEPLMPNESLMRYFPQLKRICLTDGKNRWGHETQLHSLFRKAIELRGAEIVQPMNLPHYAETTLKLLATGNLTIDELELHGIQWPMFCAEAEGLDDIEMVSALSGLKSLRVYFESPPQPDDAIPRSLLWLTQSPHRFVEGYARFGRLLRTASKLERLEIRFRFFPKWHGENLRLDWNTQLLPAHVLGSESFYSRLKHLHVDTYISTEKDWLTFFENHAGTLSSLDLGNIRLLLSSYHPQISAVSPCWVSVLKKMQGMLRLNKINLTGVLISGFARWYIKDSYKANADFVLDTSLDENLLGSAKLALPDKRHPIVGYTKAKGTRDVSQPIYYNQQSCLRTQVENWFINGGTCPLERAAAKPSGKKQSRGNKTVDPSWRGDYSFVIMTRGR